MYKCIYVVCAAVLGGLLFMYNDKINYFYYEEIPENIKEELFKTSFKDASEITIDDLVLVHILHIGFDNQVHKGELIVNKKIADDIVDIFEKLYLSDYQIEKVKLISEYNYDDILSMTDNNSSAFNYRFIENTTRLSNHSYGLAIDINPLYNPYVYTRGGEQVVSPIASLPYVDRSLDFEHKIDKNDLAYKEFTKHGFTWGGDWIDRVDYQHFEKTF